MAMRAILSDHPNLTRVRGELADTLYRMGDMEGATFNFQLLADSSATSDQRSFYDNYLTAIRHKRPWTFNAYVALAPSTNVNNGISGKTVVIAGVPFNASSHTGKSGIGLATGASGTYRFDLTPRWALTFGGKVDGNSISTMRSTRPLPPSSASSPTRRQNGAWASALPATAPGLHGTTTTGTSGRRCRSAATSAAGAR